MSRRKLEIKYDTSDEDSDTIQDPVDGSENESSTDEDIRELLNIPSQPSQEIIQPDFVVDYYGRDALHFVVHSIDYDMAYTDATDPVSCALHPVPFHPVMKIYGRHESTDQSVCCLVHNIFPYMFIKYMPSADCCELSHKEYMTKIKNDLLNIKAALNGLLKSDTAIVDCLLDEKYDFYGYHSKQEFFVKIIYSLPWQRERIRNLFTESKMMDKFFQPYEAHIEFIMQFSADYNIQYYDTIYIHNWKLDMRDPFDLNFETGDPVPNKRNTSCDIEVQCLGADILNQHYRGKKIRIIDVHPHEPKIGSQTPEDEKDMTWLFKSFESSDLNSNQSQENTQWEIMDSGSEDGASEESEVEKDDKV